MQAPSVLNRPWIGMVVGVTGFFGSVVWSACYINRPIGTACGRAGWVLGTRTCGTTPCSDFYIVNDSINALTEGSPGLDAFCLADAVCMIQRRKCGVPPGGTALLCLAAGIQSTSVQTLAACGNPCGDGDGGQ
jgi:hypothetical protein